MAYGDAWPVTLNGMSTLFAIYQWVGLFLLIAGVGYALSGMGSGLPFVARSKYSDSVLTRISAAAGIAAIWPLFLVYYLFNRGVKK